MLLRSKQLAVAGLLAALTVVLMALSSVVESSSLFFIAASSYCVGIVLREWGISWGIGFLFASTFLNVLLAPNKLYCITFAGMGLYLIFAEWLWKKIADAPAMKGRNLKLWIGKYVMFNLIYVPIIWFMPSLIVTKEMTDVLMLVLLAAGQVALPIYDYAYRYFQGYVWGRLRVKLLK